MSALTHTGHTGELLPGRNRGGRSVSEPPRQQGEKRFEVGLEYQETNVRGTAKEGCGVVGQSRSR